MSGSCRHAHPRCIASYQDLAGREPCHSVLSLPSTHKSRCTQPRTRTKARGEVACGSLDIMPDALAERAVERSERPRKRVTLGRRTRLLLAQCDSDAGRRRPVLHLVQSRRLATMGPGERFSRQAAAWVSAHERCWSAWVLRLLRHATVEEGGVRAEIRDHRIWRPRRVRPD